MSDRMHVMPFRALLRHVVNEYRILDSIFGIHKTLFYTPDSAAPYAVTDHFGQYLATPVGPAAGPHTQLSQNILCAWLCGGRFIELKTVQIMDELDIPRPCIDMADEGYNVEWSQELKLDQSAREYVNAWVMIHLLRRMLGFDAAPFGTIFNMSVGYNLEGIQSPPMIQFMDRMTDASAMIEECLGIIQEEFPEFGDLEISSRLTDNVTLSTMHGCPPEEIESIAEYLLTERRLHTTVKLNPTLIGRDRVLEILHQRLGFTDIVIPDSVFENDLKYDRALQLIRTLAETAATRNLVFGVKLSNTLAMANQRDVLPGEEMYMSGRALYPVTVSLFRQLHREFGDTLNVSFSAGADALNVAGLVAAGARPVTVASDLLKPGGYARMTQYLQELRIAMNAAEAGSLETFTRDRADTLDRLVEDALSNPRYTKRYTPESLPKVDSPLDFFDCIAAPCMDQCAVNQDIPEYIWWIAKGNPLEAAEVILHRNPLPGITGYVCTHLCQTRCTRNNYDEPVAIRRLKRFAMTHGNTGVSPRREPTERKAAIIGSGPAGLAAAYFLAYNGARVTIFESRERAGGMCAIAPEFRLPRSVINEDISRITDMGVELELSHTVTGPPETLLEQGFDAVYVACGFQKDLDLNLDGMDSQGVFMALDLLNRAARKQSLELGTRVLVVGGGNTAMDVARTARRLTGHSATVVYRRTRLEMPAEDEEIRWLLEEGNRLEELAAPTRLVVENGRITGLECIRNELGQPGPDGRRRPEPVPGSEFILDADSVVFAIGQSPDMGFLHDSSVVIARNGRILADTDTGLTDAACVYSGGDAVRGPAIIIRACADGRLAAQAMLRQMGLPFEAPFSVSSNLTEEDIIAVKKTRARKWPQIRKPELPVDQRQGLDVVEQPLSEADAEREAERCLQCSVVCDKCVEVCPNRANWSYSVPQVNWKVPVLGIISGKLSVTGHRRFNLLQNRQILHVDDFCNECGNCATFCVHTGKPFADKPRLFLQETDFNRETRNAYYIKGHSIYRQLNGEVAQLEFKNGMMVYEDPWISITLTSEFVPVEMDARQAFTYEYSLADAAEMRVLYQGVRHSLPFLLDDGMDEIVI